MVLVVEDDEATLETYARILRLDGHDVTTAVDADAGWRSLDTVVPDAIIVDLRMPHVDGLEFLRRLRARRDTQAIPVAIVTGDYSLNGATAAEVRELNARVRFKPLWVEDLSALVHEMLDPRR
jgi:DNA-binding response OmpR family regulator